jgi:hypothetical protein
MRSTYPDSASAIAIASQQRLQKRTGLPQNDGFSRIASGSNRTTMNLAVKFAGKSGYTDRWDAGRIRGRPALGGARRQERWQSCALEERLEACLTA